MSFIAKHQRSSRSIPAAGFLLYLPAWASRLLRRLMVLAACGSASLVCAQTNGVLREVYLNIEGSVLANLTNNAAYPSNPGLDSVEPNFESPPNWGTSYGVRLRALLYPPVTGDYTFYIASDDQGVLNLSTDDTPEHKQMIASMPSWVGSRQWNSQAAQKSAPIALTAGNAYYIEALMKQGGGGDNLAVAWQKPGDSAPNNNDPPIPGAYLVPYGLAAPVITQQPGSLIGIEGGQATFTIKLERALGVSYQWIRDGTNIPGATSTSYTLAPLRLTDSNTYFSCFVANAYGSTNSARALLRVNPDTTRPGISSVVNLGDNRLISVLFTEPLDSTTANQAVNYALDKGGQVLSARLSDDLRTVVLTTTPLQISTNYTLTVNNICDRAATPNYILPDTKMVFNLLYTPDVGFLSSPSEPLGPSSRTTPLVISEIMYHPPARADGRNLEYMELYNSQEWAEDISGFRISGEIDFTFPSNSIMGPKSFLVLAASPPDLQAIYGITNALPYTKALNNGSGTIRLRNRQNAVLLEAKYDSDPPYPAAADGAGHSLVLARPSWGEGHPTAWAASDRVGGTPGSNEVAAVNVYRSVMINEMLANPEAPELDYLELFNYSSSSLNLAACALTDDPATNKYRLLSTVIPPRGLLVFNSSQLGFGLSSEGETVYLVLTNGTRVIDLVRFGAQARNVALGRYPDGAPEFRELAWKTPGLNNAPPLAREVVINEIMYEPISGLVEDEYVELHNRGSNAVRLAGWRLRGGVDFNFPAWASLAPGGYLVVAQNAERLLANYPNLNAANTMGNYSGVLRNSGDTVKLLMPEEVVSSNLFGMRITNQLHVLIDQVTYGAGGRWAPEGARGGSSLELIDPKADHAMAPSWAASDESQKSGWVTIEHTGVLDNGSDSANALHVMLLGAGECLIDNVEVIPSGGVNLITNSTFSADMTGWYAQGTHERSTVEMSGGFGDDGPCLHVRASSGGDPGANRLRYNYGVTLGSGTTATLRMKVRWLKGWPEVLMRLRGNYLEASGNILTRTNFGSPGLPNNQARANGAPCIVSVAHSPVLPAAAQSVVVSARIHDPDGLSLATLYYRVDPATNYTRVALSYKGAGYYSATIPGQSYGAMVAFYLEAKDNHEVRATAVFPNDAPRRECLVRWGEPTAPGNATLGVYRYWLSKATVDKWASREKLSNDPLDGTFVYNGRIFYNVGGVYSGSPWHAPGWSSPVGNACDYELSFPADDRFLGSESVKLLTPGNGGGEATAQSEMHAYWIASELGIPFNYTRPIQLFVNGMLRNQVGPLYVDSQQPNADFMKQWWPDSEGNDLYKMVFWYEFDDAGLGFSTSIGVSLGNFTTTGGAKKLARYRWNWLKRAVQDSENNYGNLFALVDAVNTSQSGDNYTTTIESQVDVDEWARFFMLEKMVGNWDSYGNGGGQNLFGCKPGDDVWHMLVWDIDFAFTGALATNDMYNFTDTPLRRIFTHPPFQRAYYRAMQDAVNGPLVSSRSDGMLDARYTGLVAAGITPGSPAGIKSYIATRRGLILSSLAGAVVPFSITSNNGNDFSTNRNIITITGTAPPEVQTIAINGTATPVTWTSLTNWSVRTALVSGTNRLAIEGLGKSGTVIPGKTETISINYTGPDERPQDKLVINEIMYNPLAASASYLELFNSSYSNAFELTGWRLGGVDFTFDTGTIIEPQGCLVVAKDKLAFAAAYGSTIPVAGEFSGNLAHSGEIIRLVKPGATPAEDMVINRVAYEALPPWPLEADGLGPSLQLIDALQDNRRVANWAITPSNAPPPAPQWKQVVASGTASSSTLYMYLQAAGDMHIDDIVLVAGNVAEGGANALGNGGFETTFPGPWAVSANHAGSGLSSEVKHSGNYSLRMMASSGGSTRGSSIYQDISPGLSSGQPYTLSFWYLSTTNTPSFTLRLSGSGINAVVDRSTFTVTNAPLFTPGAPNSLSSNLPPFPLVWLNEIQPTNGTGITNASGQAEPWVELFNSGITNIDLSGFYLSDDYATLTNWAFPSNAVIAPGEFLLVWLDGNTSQPTNELHANFRPEPLAGSIALSRIVHGKPMLMDYLNYSVPAGGYSFGSLPDGDPIGRRTFFYVSPGASNNSAAAPVAVYINEWMADNVSALADPADAQYQDWFELYNPTTNTAYLGGCYLTDDLSNRSLFRIPDGCTVAPGGYLLVWADKEIWQNTNSDLHADFKLEKAGETIGLFAPDGTLLDAVSFGPQTGDISMGRYPDGASEIFAMTNFTPRAANELLLPNVAPIIAPIPDQVINGGEVLSLTVAAVDMNYPLQQLTFSVDPGAPPGAFIDPVSGLFTWGSTPVSVMTTNTFTIRVTDNGDPIMSSSASLRVVVLPPLVVERVRLYKSWVYLTWKVFPGKTYQVQYTEDITSGVWFNFGLPFTATGSSVNVTDTKDSGEQRFYRVVQLN